MSDVWYAPSLAASPRVSKSETSARRINSIPDDSHRSNSSSNNAFFGPPQAEAWCVRQKSVLQLKDGTTRVEPSSVDVGSASCFPNTMLPLHPALLQNASVLLAFPEKKDSEVGNTKHGADIGATYKNVIRDL